MSTYDVSSCSFLLFFRAGRGIDMFGVCSGSDGLDQMDKGPNEKVIDMCS